MIPSNLGLRELKVRHQDKLPKSITQKVYILTMTKSESKNQVKKLALAIVTVYLLYLMSVALRWRIDPHHDGIMFLPAVLGKDNALPQESLFYFYGIAQPFLEGLIFKIVPVSLINYRLIAVFLILLTGYFLYKIISLRLSKSVSLLFSLTWMFANPTWANSTGSIPISIQTPWPNLWQQTLFIFCIYIILRTNLKSFLEVALVSVLASSLPFFRIQGLFYTFCIALLVYLVRRDKLIRYLFLSLIVFLSWVTLIQVNGSVSLYLTNTITYPRNYYSLLTTFEYIFNHLIHSATYYLVCAFMLLLIFCIINFRFLKIDIWKKSLYLIILTLALGLLMKFDFTQWGGVLSRNSSTIILDAFILIAIMALMSRFIIFYRTSSRFYSISNGLIGFYSLASLSNLIFQFPLPDLGHRWWSSAILVLLMAEIYSLSFKQFTIFKKNLTRQALVVGCIVSVGASALQGVKFLSFERNDLVVSNSVVYTGIQYPDRDQETVKKFNTSLDILIFLESLGVKVDYACRDGLYFMRNKSVIAQSQYYLFSTGKERQPIIYSNNLSSQATFYCNINSMNIKNLKQFDYVIIGNIITDIFVFNDTNIYKEVLRFYREP